MTIIRAIQGDLTTLAVDAIVNAANPSLRGGGGVDGAIHRAAGPGLLGECERIGHCDTGQAVITGGHRLPARFVLHTVGPIWQGGGRNEAELLAACYRNCLVSARRHGIKSIAFPCISTGVYGYPADAAARIAVETVRSNAEGLGEVIFCCFSAADLSRYQAILEA